MLDVHILTLPDTRRDWQEQCIASVNLAASLAGYPVHVHVVPGIEGHLGQSRAAGYAAGTAPWKCYADDDDYVLPRAFEVLGRYLGRDVAAIFPREHVEQNGRLHVPTVGRHHLWPVRADLAASFPHESFVTFGDVALRNAAAKDPRGVLDIDDVVYVHRVYMGQSGRAMRRAHRNEARAA